MCGWLSVITSSEKSGSKPTLGKGMCWWGKPEARGCVTGGCRCDSYVETAQKDIAHGIMEKAKGGACPTLARQRAEGPGARTSLVCAAAYTLSTLVPADAPSPPAPSSWSHLEGPYPG